MNKNLNTLEFHKIIEMLENLAYTEGAKNNIRCLEPILSELEVRAKLRDTHEARTMLDKLGTPPFVSMKDVDKHVIAARKGGMLLPHELEYIDNILTSIRRLRDYLVRGKNYNISLAYYGDDLNCLDEVRREVQKSIRCGQIDDYASNQLRDIRRNITAIDDRMKAKADGLLRSHKEYCTDSFIVTRNGHICLPIKKEYKFKISGSVIDKSTTGATLFIEPDSIAAMNSELAMLRIDEENEERRILYCLSELIAIHGDTLITNLKLIEKLDFIFAKGRLSEIMGGITPTINTDRRIRIKQGRHPLIAKEECVPLDFNIGYDYRGLIITGPNTGGKTVAIKTVGLLSVMAQSGLHIPCEEGDICMNNLVLCDIGDGQNITENLSTFSSHITNILDILKRVSNESLVILDELGSGTDPLEGMGIAIAILEQLKETKCLFIATTHYPEVKFYAERSEGVVNARMAFDRESLKPLYRMEIGKAGESCALYIAKKLGMSDTMLEIAGKEAYGDKFVEDFIRKDALSMKDSKAKSQSPKINKMKKDIQVLTRGDKFNIGDSVMVFPEKKIGIVCKKSNDKGEIMVQLKKEKILVNHKRVQLQVKASDLYPDDYDFSIIFDSVAVRKARHQMERKHCKDLIIKEKKSE